MKAKRTASENGKRSRRKGHQFERELAIKLRPIFPEARRHLEYQMCEANGVDLVGTSYFRFQCKRLKGYSPINAINEIAYDEVLGEVPVLVTQGDGLKAMAVLPLENLLELLRDARRLDVKAG